MHPMKASIDRKAKEIQLILVSLHCPEMKCFYECCDLSKIIFKEPTSSFQKHIFFKDLAIFRHLLYSVPKDTSYSRGALSPHLSSKIYERCTGQDSQQKCSCWSRCWLQTERLKNIFPKFKESLDKHVSKKKQRINMLPFNYLKLYQIWFALDK